MLRRWGIETRCADEESTIGSNIPRKHRICLFQGDINGISFPLAPYEDPTLTPDEEKYLPPHVVKALRLSASTPSTSSSAVSTPSTGLQSANIPDARRPDASSCPIRLTSNASRTSPAVQSHPPKRARAASDRDLEEEPRAKRRKSVRFHPDVLDTGVWATGRAYLSDHAHRRLRLYLQRENLLPARDLV